LLSANNEAIRYFARRDLAGEDVPPVETLWQLPAVLAILRRQLPSGAWAYPGGKAALRDQEDYDQIETFRMMHYLIEKYGLDRRHPAIQGASEFLFAHQTDEGDLRGIYGNQYTPTYTAALMELLIKAGYDQDPRIEHGFRWLLSMRQADGGWAIPLRTVGKKFDAEVLHAPLIQPNRAKPFSHLVTGMVLRAFAAHPHYRQSAEAILAGKLLAARFFCADVYVDRHTPSFWTHFAHPFWFTDLLSALDALAWIGFPAADPQIHKALDWLIAQQQVDGLWRLALLRMAREKARDAWISLAICRVFQRFYQAGSSLTTLSSCTAGR
jgi:hypothetical protein